MPKKKEQPPSVSMVGENIISGVYASGKSTLQITQTSGSQAPSHDTELERLFKLLEEKLESRPEDPNVGKDEISDKIEQIKAEAAQGEKANQTKLERWFRNLSEMAPDIVDVIAASLSGPASGFTAVLQKIAAKVKTESEKKV